MTEFSEPHSVSKLLGSPPRYIEIVREKMNSVVLSISPQKELEEKLNQELKIHSPLEFLNRLDEIIFFNASGRAVQEIIVRELELFKQRIKAEKGIEIKYSRKVSEKIFQEVYAGEEKCKVKNYPLKYK